MFIEHFLWLAMALGARHTQWRKYARFLTVVSSCPGERGPVAAPGRWTSPWWEWAQLVQRPRGWAGVPHSGGQCVAPFRRGLRAWVTRCRELLPYTRVTLFGVIFQAEDLQQEEDGPAREQQPEGDFLVESDADDRFEPLETETFQEGSAFLGFVARSDTSPADTYMEIYGGGSVKVYLKTGQQDWSRL